MIILLSSLAFAAEGVECEATWVGPTTTCPIDGVVTVRATRRTKDSAEQAAERKLGRLMDLTADDLLRTHPNTSYAGCEDAILQEMDLECFPDDASRDGDFCFVTFEDSECWNGDVLTVDYGGWRAVVDGRHLMCEAVDAALIEQNYRGLDQRRKDCADRCAVEARVECPAWR